MNDSDKALQGLVYELATGSINLEEYPVEESQYVYNQYAEGQPCEKLYNQVYTLKVKISERLGEDENKDVENLIDALQEIERILCMKMYEYGRFFAFKEVQSYMERKIADDGNTDK
ncbi:MAG: hypothetical protein LUE61_05325 [Clostridiales bacterium]|nr:hypothetical protein [Clostridiales bacterium]